MSSSKKGMSFELVAFIMVAILIVIYFLFFASVKKSVAGPINGEICKASVQANARRIEIAGTEITPGLSDLKCQTQKITIKEPEKIKLKLANQMYDCWDAFGRGKTKFLDPESNLYCIICSKVIFEGESKGKEYKGFSSYLAETKIKDDRGIPIPGIDYTYKQFLNDYETTPGELEKIRTIQDDKINTNYDYAVMFLYYKHQNLGKPGLAAKSGIYGVAGCFTAAAAGAGFVIASGGAGAAVILPTAGVFFKSCSVLIGGAGIASGFIFGSDHSADFGGRVVTLPYKDIDQLGCTVLE